MERETSEIKINRQLSSLEWVDVPLDLNQWTWIGGEVRLGPHTSRNEVRVKYYRSLYNMDSLDADSVIAFPNAKMFLSARVAELVAGTVVRNERLELSMARIAAVAKHKIVARDVKTQQSVRIVRRPYFRLGRSRLPFATR